MIIKDYRKDVISLNDAMKKEMIGKIVVLRYEIKALEIVSEKVIEVWAYIDGCLGGFTLFTNSHAHIIDQLCEEYYKIDTQWVYLRGQIFYNDFHNRISFRPVKYIPFIVGNEKSFF